MNVIELRESHRGEKPLNMHITKQADSEGIQIELLGNRMDLIAATVSLVQEVANEIADDLPLKLAFRDMVYTEIDQAILRAMKDAGGKPSKQNPIKDMDPETASAVFGEIFGK